MDIDLRMRGGRLNTTRIDSAVDLPQEGSRLGFIFDGQNKI